MKRNEYVTYYRVSTNQQGESGLGLDAQRQAVERFTREGVVLAEYVEIETGTGKRDRPELNAAIDRCRLSGATLVVAKLDRLARNVAFVSSLMESNIEFIAADQPSANKLTVHILAAVAENEAALISARTKAALAAARNRGTVLGKPENFTNAGRRAGAETMRQKAKAAYAMILPMIQQLRDAGDSLAEIARKLNQAGQTNSRGNPFNAVQVSRILSRC